MRVQARNNVVEKIYQGNIYFMLHWYKVHVCVLKYIIWWTYMKPVKRCENRILLCMWLGEYMAWDNRTLKVIDPFSYVSLNIAARNIFGISILKLLGVFLSLQWMYCFYIYYRVLLQIFYNLFNPSPIILWFMLI